MCTIRYSAIFILAFLVQIKILQAQTVNQPLKEGLFPINSIDLHIHAGQEKQVPLNEWVDLFVKNGRKVLLLLDHLELYRWSEQEHNDYIKRHKLSNWYPNMETDKVDFMNDIRTIQNRTDALIFRGWEIWEGELDEGLDKEPMKDAEVIGWHISKAAWDGKAPAGKEFISRARQILEVQKEFPVPMIIFHPFRTYYDEVRKLATKAGRDIKSIKKDEYRYFTSAQQKEVIGLLAGSSVYVELSKGFMSLWSDPVVREAFIDDIKPLVDAGVKFTVSTDAHDLPDVTAPYNPEEQCRALGISTENVNSVIRELLAIRARKNLQ